MAHDPILGRATFRCDRLNGAIAGWRHHYLTANVTWDWRVEDTGFSTRHNRLIRTLLF